MCGILDTLCHISLYSCLEAEPEYQNMIKDNLFNTITLHKLVLKICNRSTFVVVEDVIGNALESIYLVMLLKGENFPSLSKYLEATIQRYKCFEQAGCEFATDQIRDTYLEALLSCREDDSLVFK